MATAHGAGAWYVGAYKYGMGRNFNDATARDTTKMKAYACLSIKNELVYLGYGDKLDLDKWFYGKHTVNAVKEFQQANALVVDGETGRNTATKLYKPRIFSVEFQFKIPNHYLAKIYAVESGFDPGAIGYADPNDHGLVQINQPSHPTVTWQQSADGMFCAVFIGNLYMDHYDILKDYDAAAVAHNVGLGGAEAWVAAGKPADSVAGKYLELLNKQVV